MLVIQGFDTQNVIACYNETPGGGDVMSFTAPCNAPARFPEQHLDKVVWHSSFLQFELAMPEQVVTVGHPAVPGLRRYIGIRQQTTPISPPTGIQISVYGQDITTFHTLVAHNLGYTPHVFVVYGNHMLGAGEVVQSESAGRNRTVSVYADASVVGLKDVGRSFDAELPAVSRTYRLLICKTPTASPSLPLYSGPTPLQLARGKIGSGKSMLRKAGLGSSAYALNLNRTMDLNNGRVRWATGGVTATEGDYFGSFAGSPFRQVGV